MRRTFTDGSFLSAAKKREAPFCNVLCICNHDQGPETACVFVCLLRMFEKYRCVSPAWAEGKKAAPLVGSTQREQGAIWITGLMPCYICALTGSLKVFSSPRQRRCGVLRWLHGLSGRGSMPRWEQTGSPFDAETPLLMWLRTNQMKGAILMPANLYRIEKGKVHVAGRAVILDRGQMHSAPPSGKNGNYLFSEIGAGVHELALVGTKQDILTWLGQHAEYSIENRIPELPDIYMGVEPYKPGQRFKGLFPVNDALKAVFDTTMGIFGPSNSASEVIGGAGDLKSALTFRPEIGVSEKDSGIGGDGEIFVKFSYMSGDKMYNIANKQIDFRTIGAFLRQVL